MKKKKRCREDLIACALSQPSFALMGVTEAPRPKQLKYENAKVKRLATDMGLDTAILQGVG